MEKTFTLKEVISIISNFVFISLLDYVVINEPKSFAKNDVIYEGKEILTWY